LHGFLAASGPDFHEGATTTLPTGAVDLTPTILHLLGLETSFEFDGRVLWEAMGDPSGEPGDHQSERIGPAIQHAAGFEPQILLERVGSTRYVDRVLNSSGARSQTTR